MQTTATTIHDNNSVASSVIQVNGYLSLPIEEFERLPNPLLYWRKNLQSYTELQEIARKYLIMPASSVPSERAASAAGNTITTKRSCLSAEHAENLVFLQKNSFLLDVNKKRKYSSDWVIPVMNELMIFIIIT